MTRTGHMAKRKRDRSCETLLWPRWICLFCSAFCEFTRIRPILRQNRTAKCAERVHILVICLSALKGQRARETRTRFRTIYMYECSGSEYDRLCLTRKFIAPQKPKYVVMMNKHRRVGCKSPNVRIQEILVVSRAYTNNDIYSTMEIKVHKLICVLLKNKQKKMNKYKE